MSEDTYSINQILIEIDNVKRILEDLTSKINKLQNTVDTMKK